MDSPEPHRRVRRRPFVPPYGTRRRPYRYRLRQPDGSDDEEEEPTATVGMQQRHPNRHHGPHIRRRNTGPGGGSDHQPERSRQDLHTRSAPTTGAPTRSGRGGAMRGGRGMGWGGTTPRGSWDRTGRLTAGYQSTISIQSHSTPHYSRPHQSNTHVNSTGRPSKHTPLPRDGPSVRSQFERSHTTPRLSIASLKTIAECSGDLQTVDEVFSNLKGFQQSLNTCNSLRSDWQKNQYVEIVLTIISKVCMLVEEETSMKILGEFLSERCEQFHMLLTEYVQKLSDDPFSAKIEQLCNIFEVLLTRLPNSSWNVLPINDLSEAANSMLLSEMLMEKIQYLKQRRNEIKNLFKSKAASGKNNSSGVDAEFEDWDDSLFRTIEILPSIAEVCSSFPPVLRPNIIRGSYKGWDHYYDVQFRLLREDFVAPLRRGIQSFLQGATGRNLHDINLYQDVQVHEPVFTKQGMCFKLSFNNSRFRKNWEHSKRLMYGSLLCLSSDGFKDEMLFGTVLDRNTEDLDDGFFNAKFDDHKCLFDHRSRKTSFIMAESRAYFEASCHILRSLQTAEVETMPFYTITLFSIQTSMMKVKSSQTTSLILFQQIFCL